MYYFIVNKSARTGKAEAVWNEVKLILEKHKVEYKAYETIYKGHAAELAGALSELPEDKVHIIILGGDGTINEVVNGIKDFKKVRLGVIPTGSGNDFARNLNIKGSTEDTILDILKHKEGTMLDIGAVTWNERQNRRLFTISSGVGFDAVVCKKSLTSKFKKFFNSIHLGKLTYIVITIQSLFTLRTFKGSFSLRKDVANQYNKIIFGAAMNLRAEGGGVPIAPKSNPSDGLISFCVAADIPALVLPFCLILLVMGKHEKLKYFHQYNDVECHIHSETPVVLHADGEYLADITDVWYECLPRQIELLNTVKTND